MLRFSRETSIGKHRIIKLLSVLQGVIPCQITPPPKKFKTVPPSPDFD